MIRITPDLESYLLNLLKVCAHTFDVTIFQTIAARKIKRTVQARAVFFVLVRRRLKLSYPELASVFGLDHVTAMLGCRNAPKDKTQLVHEATAAWPLPAILRSETVRNKPRKYPPRQCPACSLRMTLPIKGRPGWRYCERCNHTWPADKYGRPIKQEQKREA